ncbi:MAG: hydrogenase accessory protein HypB [Bacteroidetes bacterium GWF2_38_335]|nr:MAG: hydrogenase accessory protein HypB [Bacteroidetes bacterium GWF2_38_335]OFY81710.1 MAG: hydrogenase accessory protein HypB [Bacteroidetes bacterium RIFOXYA12_FULL_38_20]HBS87774.1 hydrogenase accessory protein HypB [Bacteroidales bacterium]
MCGTCGCGDDSTTFRKPGEKHDHEHHHTHSHSHDHDGKEHTHDHDHKHTHDHHHDHGHHDHDHSHDHDHHHHDHDHEHEGNAHHHHSHEKEIMVERNVLSKNDLIAERNRGFFEAKNIVALNLVSSPGSGKTSLLEKTIKEMGKELKCFVIEGDQQTMNDAERIHAAGAPVIQVNTGNGCHLDAEMVNTAVKKLDVKEKSVLFIENVGNLVCPSMFDLGESKRVVIISTTEGDDKPLKYPTMFETAHICIINKTDLLPYVDFDMKKCRENAMKVNHHLEFFEVSVKTGEGMKDWYKWLKKLEK